MTNEQFDKAQELIANMEIHLQTIEKMKTVPGVTINDNYFDDKELKSYIYRALQSRLEQLQNDFANL